ncbi:glycine cleavage system aminomethyltransferase GcvT [Mycolicibacterium helvum]|uniref:Aminomethyltransferase n=1 Tax=Mycolicibacterium helvum TaxID=1534349 RepID=A0A7I7TBL3_9MYCO|nr:glycine cleavage system aminomethyltransferase GcvT [Mycolicibacterium helvum]BBY65546.1 aminomethyltransferase [Mycolicibacterium helvum]
MTHETPLLAEHRSLGATFTDFAGWQMPLKYGSDLKEHHAVRTAAGVFDLSHMGEIHVVGPGAAAALDYALVGELSAVPVGRAKYSLLCNENGGVVDDLVVYRLADNDFLVVANASNAATVYAELSSRAAAFDADVFDESGDTALIAVQGPESVAILTAMMDGDAPGMLSALKYYASTPAVVAGIDVLLARTGYTGEDGFELYVANARAVGLWHALVDVTAAHGGIPAGLASRDTLRLEAGMALYGHELTEATNPYEAGLGRMLRLGKNFVGSEALQRLSKAPLARCLVGLTGTGRRAARAGYTVERDGAEVGAITSGALSPTLGHPIALGYVDAAYSEPGTVLQVGIRGTANEFTVTAPPFYKRP